VGTPLVRLVVSAVLAAGLAGVVTGCSAGQTTQTDRTVAAVPGAYGDAADRSVSLRDVLVAYQPNGCPAGGTGPLSVNIVNNQLQAPVKLVGVTSDAGTVVSAGTGEPLTGSGSPSASAAASASASASRTAAPSGSARPSGSASPSASPSPSATAAFTAVSIPASGYARLAPDSGGRYLAITGLTKALRPGESVTLIFTFDNRQTVQVTVPMGLPTVAPTRSPIELPSAGSE